jgi:hypothetical protein
MVQSELSIAFSPIFAQQVIGKRQDSDRKAERFLAMSGEESNKNLLVIQEAKRECHRKKRSPGKKLRLFVIGAPDFRKMQADRTEIDHETQSKNAMSSASCSQCHH